MTAEQIDFTTVSESQGTLISREAMDMARTRYTFAAELCRGKRVLEVACGPGAGLGMLAAQALRVVGADYTFSLLRQGAAHYKGRIPLVRLDAGHLPFGADTFDVVVLFEAIYFLPDVPAFLASCHRVLGPGGTLVIGTVNPAWDAFNPSPHSTRYWSAEELDALARAQGFKPELYAAFPASDASLRGQITAVVKRLAVRYHLMPRTMKGKAFLKRVAFGRLDRFPAELGAGTGTYHEPTALADARSASGFKVLYVKARKR